MKYTRQYRKIYRNEIRVYANYPSEHVQLHRINLDNGMSIILIADVIEQVDKDKVKEILKEVAESL